MRCRDLVAAQVEGAQGEYRRGRGRGQNAWVVIVLAQGDNADDGEDDGEAAGDNEWVEDEDEDESTNACVVFPPLRNAINHGLETVDDAPQPPTPATPTP